MLSTPEGVDRAFKKLDELSPNLVWWEAGAQPLQLLASGEVAMTSAYNGRITAINKSEDRKFKVVWPGSIYAAASAVDRKQIDHEPDQAADEQGLGESLLSAIDNLFRGRDVTDETTAN